MNPTEIITNLGIVAPAPRGVHNPNTRYYRLNIVTNGIDASYICIRNTIEGTPLSDETHWMPLAKGALQLWLEQGGTGDLEDFLTWLKSPNNVYIGAGPPPDGYTVWIDPTAGSSLETAVIKFNEAALLAYEAAAFATNEANFAQQARLELVDAVNIKLAQMNSAINNAVNVTNSTSALLIQAEQALIAIGIATNNAQTKANYAEAKGNLANEAAITANNAADALLSNVISLEIRDDMHLYMTTPDVYSGFMFKIENGSLIAII